ncbi:MAG: hypothetical protein M1819_003300 [Sarea resinae]|nr:MAG: hypothetical protein M1819_003300 [Sarea resinae]
MPLMSLFALPLTDGQQVQTSRSSQYKRPTKRKRDALEEPDLANERSNPTAADPDDLAAASPTFVAINHQPRAPSPGSYHSLRSEDVRQYRVAGQPFDEPLPEAPFPHRPSPRRTGDSDDGQDDGKAREGLASLSPPLYGPDADASSAGVRSGTKLRMRHLAVMTAILHRSLLDGDFVRAGRAWGALLRTEMAGRGMDIRAGGKWGIGAEILLRRSVPSQRFESNGQDEEDDTSSPRLSDTAEEDSSSPPGWFSKDGFEKAKEYYERLILQYPFRKGFPGEISPLQFYLAMFGLWIYSIQQDSRTSRQKIDLSRRDDSEGQMSEDEQPLSSDQRDNKDRKHEQYEEVRLEELKQAQELAARLEELLLSPPYSDDWQLWHLHGMIALWVGDLHVPTRSSEDEDSDGFDDPQSTERRLGRVLARSDHERSLERKAEEIDKAREAFKRVVATGGRVWSGVDYIVQDIARVGDPGGWE